MSYDLEGVKAAVSCRQLLEDNGIPVNRQGFAVCPFHGDRDASLKVYRGDRGWCCFGCHKGGDVINLARELYGLSFRDAVQRLGEDYGLSEATGPQLRQQRALAHARRMRALAAEKQKAASCDACLDALGAWICADRAVCEADRGEWTETLSSALRARETARINAIEAAERRDAIWIRYHEA